ncbi:GNAT family N-acetyltransferase [Microbacterium ulmi]|uniref:GNAT family N-acetyltransferase n=1 Tax=Microbacterium ulmi TaxID=179095 RepID=A0A7Y2LZK3_9MICO|nr:GNAT family protein [Microbacterium ulmi]NII69244.1 aminoglycoside 6'-N-acetyltransferase [Microbacterium ulmi]NNH03781.1 GNAT family N-acetyltransferase [Microbacterium ulmi]
MALPWDFHPIEGERVRLDLLRDDDLDDLYALQSDPEVCRYLLYEPRSRERVAHVLARDAAAARLESPHDYLQPAIRDRDGRFLGTMYFELHSVDPDRTAEIGWILAPHAQGEGYASEAARLLLGLAFEELGLHRVYAELDPRNGASVALCERLGMRHEGHFVEHMWLKGEWTDTGHYAILEHEWAARRA